MTFSHFCGDKNKNLWVPAFAGVKKGRKRDAYSLFDFSASHYYV